MKCPNCQHIISKLNTPYVTADCIIYDSKQGIILIERLNKPHGFALPGGFVDIGESVENAAKREMKEETGLDVDLLGILGVYSRPDRDPRFHTLTVTYVAKAQDSEKLQAGDDALRTSFYSLDNIPPLCFDHDEAVAHFRMYLKGERILLPCTV